MNAPRWRAWLAAAGIMLFGVALGTAVTCWIGVRIVRDAVQRAAERNFAERVANRIGGDLTTALRLTPDETKRVQAILDDAATRMRTARTDANTQALAELRAASQRIAAELPPRKRMEFRRMMLRRYERLGLQPPAFDAAPPAEIEKQSK